MSELNRFPDEEPDTRDRDYNGTDSYRDLDSSIGGISAIDDRFDQDNPEDAKRIQEESGSGEDPSGKNLATRRGGGK
ncbi:MAG: hypothetical protein WCP56_03575 [Candidatus Saccharibacteria bacterium]